MYEVIRYDAIRKLTSSRPSPVTSTTSSSSSTCCCQHHANSSWLARCTYTATHSNTYRLPVMTLRVLSGRCPSTSEVAISNGFSRRSWWFQCYFDVDIDVGEIWNYFEIVLVLLRKWFDSLVTSTVDFRALPRDKPRGNALLFTSTWTLLLM